MCITWATCSSHQRRVYKISLLAPSRYTTSWCCCSVCSLQSICHPSALQGSSPDIVNTSSPALMPPVDRSTLQSLLTVTHPIWQLPSARLQQPAGLTLADKHATVCALSLVLASHDRGNCVKAGQGRADTAEEICCTLTLRVSALHCITEPV